MNSQHGSFHKEFMQAGDSFGRWHVIRGAGDTRNLDAVDDLLEVLERPALDLGDTDERAIAAWSLGRMGLDAFLSRIPCQGAVLGRSTLHRAGIVDALGETRDPNAIEAIAGILQSESERQVWLLGTLALSKTGTPALDCLLKLAIDASLEQKIMIIDAIHKIGGDSAKHALEKVQALLSQSDLEAAEEVLSRYN